MRSKACVREMVGLFAGGLQVEKYGIMGQLVCE